MERIILVNKSQLLNFTNNNEVYLYISTKQTNIEVNINIKANIKLFLYIDKIENLTFNINVQKYLICNIYQVSLKNTTYNLNMNINIYKNSVLDIYNLLLLNNKADRKINQLEVFHKEEGAKNNIHSISLINQGYIEVNCLNHILKKANDSYISQNLRSILLSNHAFALNRPILKIFNKNIFAKHSNAIGKISENEIYYLQSKGFTKKEAIQLICSGYFRKFIKNCANDKIKNKIINALNEYEKL